jgi:3-hydroxybutyryl-CoA dehydrogenase
VPEDLALKGEVVSPIAAYFPDAVIASNTSSLSIGAIGEACGAAERTVGTHYWNPPLLMPLVEIIAGARSTPVAVELARAAVASCGKRPVLVQRDVPGFIWNRLQYALLREALWIVDNGVATPEAVDEVVRFGNARRWEHVGPFAAAALGGIATWQRVAGELFPELSNARDAGDLGRALWADEAALAEIAAARDTELARDLRER